MGLLEDLGDWAYRKRITIVRRIVLLALFVFLNSMLFGMFSFSDEPILFDVFLPNASCRYITNAPTYCYYYSLQLWLQTGNHNAYMDLFAPMLIILMEIILLGRFWCSWACPFGLIQEIMMSIRSSLRIPHIQLRQKWIVLLDQFKYAMLFFTLLVALSIGMPMLGLSGYSSTLSLPFCQLCPAKPVFTLLQEAADITPPASLPWAAIIMLVVFLIGSFFIRMFWCRICPMGAFMAMFNRRSLIWLRKDPAKCTKCRICLRVCPQDFDTVYEEMEKENINGPECTLCGRCVEACPEEGALGIAVLHKTVVRSKPRR